jgi:hypothetical protein
MMEMEFDDDEPQIQFEHLQNDQFGAMKDLVGVGVAKSNQFCQTDPIHERNKEMEDFA